jgi:mono/diheme cytochrome c family protein
MTGRISDWWCTQIGRNGRLRRFASAGAVVVAAEVLVAVVLLGTAAEPENLGKTAFERICSGCHGDKGAGDIGPRLVPFTWSNREVLAIVREGNGMMPAMSARDISDEEIAALADYLRSLSAKSDRDSAPKSTSRH